MSKNYYTTLTYLIMKRKYSTSFTLVHKGLTALTFALLCTLYACKEEESIVQEETLQSEDAKGWNIRFNKEGNYLEFESYDIFQETLDTLRSMKSGEAIAWSEQHGIVSLKSMYSKAVLEQDIYINHLETQNVEDIEKVDKYAPFIRNHKQSFILNEKNNDFDINIFSHNIANVVNSNGIVKIGNTISQYTNEYVKVLENADDGSISELIKSTDSEIHSNVTINKVVWQDFDDVLHNNRTISDFSYRCENIISGTPLCRGTRVNGRFRIYSYVDASQTERTTISVGLKHYLSGVFGWNLNIGKYGYLAIYGVVGVYDRYGGPAVFEEDIYFSTRGDEDDPSIGYTLYEGTAVNFKGPVVRFSSYDNSSDFCDIPLWCDIDIFNRGISVYHDRTY